MANYNKSNGKRWAAFWAGAIAFIIIAAVLAGVIGWRTSGYKDWTFGFAAAKPGETAKPGNDDKDPDEDKPEGNGNSLLVTPEEGGASVMSLAVAPMSSTPDSYTITATVKPDHATIKDVTWSMQFKNPSSGWASGKACDSYINLSVNAIANTATVKCKLPFGEQILLIATADGTPSVKSSCTLDYVKRVESATINFKTTRLYLGDDVERQQVDMTYTLGTGTISGTFEWDNSVTVSTTGDLISSKYYNPFYKAADAENPDFDDVYTSFSSTGNDEVLFGIPDRCFAQNDDGTFFSSRNTNTDNLYCAMVYDALGGTTNNAYIEILYTYTYGGKSYGGARVKSNNFTLDVSNLYVNVDDLNLNYGGIVF